MVHILLNGKKAGYDSVRSAITALREQVDKVEVRVTYEYGDIERFVNEAVRDNVQRIVIGGGDGSVNEVVNAMARLPAEQRPELAILPLGTANDFATACQIPANSLEALHLAVAGKCSAIDMIKTNDRYCVNMATAGFGAQVTTETPVELKNFLGGGAYTLTGVLKAINFIPFEGRLKTPDIEADQTGVVAAVCNGRQAGGGQVLAPKAFINDGLLDVVIISQFPLADIPRVLEEIRNPSADGLYIKYFQTPWIESISDEIIPVNLDGEPYQSKKIRFEVMPEAIKLVLPESCPCLK
ncbi:lipid kinase YegS [methanotrophic endosymbiont of Bathymodiolus puteoserpentis (Logatchev)]|jgi:lipid kinase YegS|uniref:lipid kinase YegS n=1 Tax=methanotrophic endosymbiont of Bathymodiolus puteoserpentis (Logatchev) TaxID=343235 RepID=UPI0013C65178|nr:lipid kinase YegS [methanotrophic endosymbiont of Bathymodiolus puteoserpentis (Logatchev)]SHE23131.1 Transcription regulator [contains diacylglycerol kinase catalytic domain] [methanotrophic endosymbiont of Bathymodiolus puteoserpentis (Logatchev)]